MNIERAIEIAVEAHKGVIDKGGMPYILHPLTVMHNLETEEEKMVGVLHDVVEDSDWTFDRLEEAGFSDTVIDALRSVTKSPADADYFSFVGRAKANPIGRRVKIEDLKHNMQIRRLNHLSDSDTDRLNRYMESLRILTDGSNY